jgi:hypothetical protein
VQTQLETLYLVKDADEVWGTYCRECAGEQGKEFGLVWDTYPFKPESMHTPNGVDRPEGEEVEPEVYAPEIFESDMPLGCEDCGIWLDASLTKYGLELLTDQDEEYPQEVIDLYLN